MLVNQKLGFARLIGQILLLLVGMATSFFFLDGFYCGLVEEQQFPGDLQDFLDYLSAFGHITGCFIAILLIWSLDPKNRPSIKLVIGSTLLAGLIATLMKVAFHRARPSSFFEIGNVDVTLSDAVFHNSLQSFPSGHTATAFALAGALTLSYPRGKNLFHSLAIVTGFQRVISRSHFPSDVFAGAIIGILSAVMAGQIWQMHLLKRDALWAATDRTTDPTLLMPDRDTKTQIVADDQGSKLDSLRV